MGHTSGGRLRHPAKMPASGPGFALLPHIPSRRTRYGTDEMVGLLQRTGKRLKSRSRANVMRIGNLGSKGGGRIHWSVSHRAGRDADLAFFALTRRGGRARLTDFVKFDRRGKSLDKQFRFDTRRNLDLIRTLLTDPKVNIQWIFVFRPLRKKLLRLARRKRLPAALIEKMETVMRQPSDSAPHNDHFHVRIYCSRQDVLHGCQNRGPFHSWVKPATGIYKERVRALAHLTKAPDAAYRRRAIEKLVDLNAQSATYAYMAALTDPDDRVFDAAIDALKVLMPNNRVAALSQPLAQQTSARRAAAITKLAVRRGTAAAAKLCVKILTQPSTAFSNQLDTVDERSPSWAAALPLVGRSGRRTEALALVEAMSAGAWKSPQVRTEAHLALRALTNHTAMPKSSTAPGLAAHWRAFASRHGKKSWLEWLKMGFENRGYRFRGTMKSRTNIPVLIRAAAHKDPAINGNAVRLLNALTGQKVAPNRRDRKWRARFFKRYWRRNRRSIQRRNRG